MAIKKLHYTGYIPQDWLNSLIDTINKSNQSSEDISADLAELEEQLNQSIDEKIKTLIGTATEGADTLGELESKIPTKVSDLENDSNFITDEEDPTVPAHVKSITSENISAWTNKSDFDGNYSSLSGTPTIPTKVSDLENDSKFVTEETYNQEVGELESSISELTSRIEALEGAAG